MANPSGIQSFLLGRCPQCRRGSIFKTGLISTKFKDVHEHCPHCRVKYEQEPGFFWGAMYVSYALIVGLLIFLSILMFSIYEDPSLLLLSLVIIGVSVVFTPFIMRLSRLILIYIAAPYRQFKKELYDGKTQDQ